MDGIGQVASAHVEPQHGRQRKVCVPVARVRAAPASSDMVGKVSRRSAENERQAVHPGGLSSSRDIHSPWGYNARFVVGVPTAANRDARTARVQLVGIAVAAGAALVSFPAVAILVGCAFFGKLPHAHWHHAVLIVASTAVGLFHSIARILLLVVGVACFICANWITGTATVQTPAVSPTDEEESMLGVEEPPQKSCALFF